MESKCSFPYSQVLATCPCTEPARSSPCPQSNFPKIHLDIILPSTSGTSKWFLSLRFPHKNPVYISPLPHTGVLHTNKMLTPLSLTPHRITFIQRIPFFNVPGHQHTGSLNIADRTLPYLDSGTGRIPLKSVVMRFTWCGYKITGFIFFPPLPCKLGNSERCVVLAYALPSIYGYNFKVVRQTVWQ